MRAIYEIAGKFEEPVPCETLVNGWVDPAVTVRRSRVYEFAYSGDGEALGGFVRHCLFDPISQVLGRDEGLWPEAGFVLDVAMKPGALDLEKEAILDVQRRWPEAGFRIESLRLHHRYAAFGPVTAEVIRRMERDLVNPAIQTRRVARP
jgi:hypothetical protein